VRIHETLRARLRQRVGRHKHPSAGWLDSQSIKGTATLGARGYDAGKKINGRKRHILVDTLGLVLMVVVTAASVRVCKIATARVGSCAACRLSYASRRAAVSSCCLVAGSSSGPSPGSTTPVDSAKIYERLMSTSETWIYLAMIKLMANRPA
jgi:putative transposase